MKKYTVSFDTVGNTAKPEGKKVRCDYNKLITNSIFLYELAQQVWGGLSYFESVCFQKNSLFSEFDSNRIRHEIRRQYDTDRKDFASIPSGVCVFVRSTAECKNVRGFAPGEGSGERQVPQYEARGTSAS